MSLTQFVRVNVSITVPGHGEPIKLDQWIPITTSDQALSQHIASLPSTAPASPAALVVQCPPRPHPKHASQIVVNGLLRTVPARVAAVLAQIAAGAEVVSYRPETAESLQELLPEILPGLTRDWSRKVMGKHASYTVAVWVREALAVARRVPGHVPPPASPQA